jgi:alcohol dehydrogenase
MLEEHHHALIPMNRIVANELEILGSHGIQAHKYPEIFQMIRAGKLHPEKLIGKTISLEESLEALVTMDSFSGAGVRVINRF